MFLHLITIGAAWEHRVLLEGVACTYLVKVTLSPRTSDYIQIFINETL